MKQQKTRKHGFTLVEILIVVIILGILAAIVLPQFSNATTDARKSNVASQLQTLRSQITLYLYQHNDKYSPMLCAGGPTVWDEMTIKTNPDNTTTGNPHCGPYVQANPINALNNAWTVAVVSGTTDYGAGGMANPNGNVGWIFNSTTGHFWATSAHFGYVYNEANPSDPNNAN